MCESGSDNGNTFASRVLASLAKCREVHRWAPAKLPSFLSFGAGDLIFRGRFVGSSSFWTNFFLGGCANIIAFRNRIANGGKPKKRMRSFVGTVATSFDGNPPSF